MTVLEYFLVGGAAVLAGIVNALAGGGTLITFPVLIAMGIPTVPANVTNTVALCPGYFGGSWAQRKDLKTQSGRIAWLLPVSAIGGLAGGLLLLHTGEDLFSQIVPFLILSASLILALQGPIRKWLSKRNISNKSGNEPVAVAVVPAFLSAVYGGYFGAGLGIIVLSVLGICFSDSLLRLNALKQVISLTVNVAAASFFLFSGEVVWLIALIMATGALLGGWIGGKLAGKIRQGILRWTVVFIGIIVAGYYFSRQFLQL